MLVLYVDGLIVILRVDNRGKIEPLGIGARESRISVGTPLHRCAHTVTITEIKVVAHTDFVTIVNDRCARQGEEETVHQFDLFAVIVQERRQPPTDAEIQLGGRVAGIHPVHVVPLFIGDHLKGQFIMVTEKDSPLAPLGNWRRLLENLNQGKAVLHADGHEHAGHERKMKSHMKLLVAEIGRCIFGPLIGLGQEHAILEFLVHVLAQLPQEKVRFGQVFAVGAFSFVEIGHRVSSKSINSQSQPEIYDSEDSPPDRRIIVIQVRLV